MANVASACSQPLWTVGSRALSATLALPAMSRRLRTTATQQPTDRPTHGNLGIVAPVNRLARSPTPSLETCHAAPTATPALRNRGPSSSFLLLSAVSCPPSLCTADFRRPDACRGPFVVVPRTAYSPTRQEGPDGLPPDPADGLAILTRLCRNLVVANKPGSHSTHGGQAAIQTQLRFAVLRASGRDDDGLVMPYTLYDHYRTR